MIFASRNTAQWSKTVLLHQLGKVISGVVDAIAEGDAIKDWWCIRERLMSFLEADGKGRGRCRNREGDVAGEVDALPGVQVNAAF